MILCLAVRQVHAAHSCLSFQPALLGALQVCCSGAQLGQGVHLAAIVICGYLLIWPWGRPLHHSGI
jgi:hypothetical protein